MWHSAENRRERHAKESKPDEPYVSKHDFSLKEGQTFKINIKVGIPLCVVGTGCVVTHGE